MLRFILALSLLLPACLVATDPAQGDGWAIDENTTGAPLVVMNHNVEISRMTTTGGWVLDGGVGAIDFDNTASSITLNDNDTTALLIGSTGQLGLLTFDTGDATETVVVNGTTTVTAFHVDVGTSLFDELITVGAGAGALTFTNGAASFVLADADTTALTIGAAGALDIFVVNTSDTVPKVTLKGITTQDAFHVDVGTSLFDELLNIGAAAGAFTFTSGDASILLVDADTTALAIGAAGATDILVINTSDTVPKVTITGITTQDAFTVPVGTSLFTEGVDAAIVATTLQHFRFCGNGPNGSTPSYMGPVLLDDTEADLAYGGAGCDSLDHATEGNVDDALHAGFAYQVVGMACVGLCPGASAANDAIVFQLRDDTADVTGMTCTTSVLTGDGLPQQCTLRDPTPVTVAAASLMAVKMTMTDDACTDAGDDFECVIFVTF